MKVEIDSQSGFCHGVTTAIRKAEEELTHADSLYCLGDIVHNGSECERLHKLGLLSVDHDALQTLHDTTLLLRAHGEPPSTYKMAQQQNIHLIDATCPVVLNLQKRIRTAYEEIKREESKSGTQIVIYGKPGHAEVIGLVGQTEGNAIVIENLEDAARLDFSRNILLYSQTTQPLEGFREVVNFIEAKITSQEKTSQPHNLTISQPHFQYYDTICRQVANRIQNIRQFAERHSVVLFVCGKKSSNGRVLFAECHEANPRSYMIDGADEIRSEWFEGAESVGICGATSTPKWLMEECKERIKELKDDRLINN